MLKDFIGNIGFKKIPYTSSVYEISCSGCIRETVSKKELVFEIRSGEKYIPREATGEWFDDIALTVVLGVTYRNCLLPIRLLKYLKVIYKDGDVSNNRLTNFIWAPHSEKIEHPLFKGLRYIPGYSRYLIDINGNLLSVAHGNYLSPYVNDDGYLMYGVQPDVGKRTIVGMHRLLALAYLPYSAQVDSLDVNHIDAVKNNNYISNLEWVSRKRNSIHAHGAGLCNSKAVLLKNVSTGRIDRFYSIEEAGRYLDVDGETIRTRLMRPLANIYHHKYQMKFENDDTEWPTIEDSVFIETSRKVSIECIKTGAILIKNSVKEAAEFFDIKPSLMSYHLRKNMTGYIYNEYFIKYDSPHIQK